MIPIILAVVVSKFFFQLMLIQGDSMLPSYHNMQLVVLNKYDRTYEVGDVKIPFELESSDANNHFVSLISNGEAREFKGSGSGANPRTAIGQRADGAILLLVTDGRGASSHLGATASDLIGIMQEYGAVNAANLDGGSSSAMYYNGGYEMTSVTLYYSTSSWRLPTAFVVEGRDSHDGINGCSSFNLITIGWDFSDSNSVTSGWDILSL